MGYATLPDLKPPTCREVMCAALQRSLLLPHVPVVLRNDSLDQSQTYHLGEDDNSPLALFSHQTLDVFSCFIDAPT